ncbi:Uncharacterised protein [Mycobacteroides abscessus subsp. abscessus]|nr:Uncharacterised protein [Mycobacteroides abscessus subsp. abscessus]
MSNMRSRARRISWRRGRSSGRVCISPSNVAMSCCNPHRFRSRNARSTSPSRYSASSPLVALSPNGIGDQKYLPISGLAAASI